MARKNYSEEFRRQAVELYESTPGATVRGIAADLGVERGTLRHWLGLHGTGRKTAADGTATRSPLRASGAGTTSASGVGSRFQFVADPQAPFEVKRLCELVEVDRSSYYAWRAAAPARAARAEADRQLAERIRAAHEAGNPVGGPR